MTGAGLIREVCAENRRVKNCAQVAHRGLDLIIVGVFCWKGDTDRVQLAGGKVKVLVD